MRIIKSGITNEVSEEMFNKIYKPKGWKKFEEAPISINDKTIKDLKTQEKISNYNKMKKVKVENFDDNIIKKD